MEDREFNLELDMQNNPEKYMDDFENSITSFEYGELKSNWNDKSNQKFSITVVRGDDDLYLLIQKARNYVKNILNKKEIEEIDNRLKKKEEEYRILCEKINNSESLIRLNQKRNVIIEKVDALNDVLNGNSVKHFLNDDDLPPF